MQPPRQKGCISFNLNRPPLNFPSPLWNSPSENFPRIFDHFPIVRFGWNFVYTLILQPYFVDFHFFPKMPSLNFPSPPENFPRMFDHFPIVRFGLNFVYTLILQPHFVDFDFFPKIPSLNFPPPCEVPPQKNFRVYLTTFPLFDLDEISYIRLFCNPSL